MKWNHTNILHTVMVLTDEMIFQNCYFLGIRAAVQKELKKGDICQRKKRSAKHTVNHQPRWWKKHRGINYV